MDSPPVHFGPVLRDCATPPADVLGLRSRQIVSGAGQDALYTACATPTAMIFTPCGGGISHHPPESITEEETGNGADALLLEVLAAELALP